jgi:hypothetical protein
MKHFGFGLIYTLIYAALTIMNVGPEGRGTSIFFAPWLPWFLLFIVLFLLHVGESKIFISIVMVVHYAFTLVFLPQYWNDGLREYSSLMWGWEHHRGLMLSALGWYLLGQIYIWVSLFKMQRNTQALTSRNNDPF